MCVEIMEACLSEASVAEQPLGAVLLGANGDGRQGDLPPFQAVCLLQLSLNVGPPPRLRHTLQACPCTAFVSSLNLHGMRLLARWSKLQEASVFTFLGLLCPYMH